mmetsp:Transcript_111822/g.198066  ORF Transcript_111822/g.198066 Transcript_111822/m.198066 type:complete len:340 (+) Transcript_111822:78-1097(+)
MASGRGMGRTASSVGMMEGAFFVSRGELLQWVNSLLQVNLTKVEQCASGSIYCQIVDACHTGSVAMKKVNWMAKADHEYIPNYKILQAAFDRNSIEKHIDVDKLIRAKYQDNLEFLQWMKCYFDREGEKQGYDPVRAREGRPVPVWARPLGAPSGGSFVGEKENMRPQVVDASKKTRAPAAATAINSVVAGARPNTGPSPRPAARPPPSGPPSKTADPADNGADLKAKCSKQQEELEELRHVLDGLERERDYYFRKLRNVEILCNTLEAKMDTSLTPERIIQDVQGILYAEYDEEDNDACTDSAAVGNAAPPADASTEVTLNTTSCGETSLADATAVSH